MISAQPKMSGIYAIRKDGREYIGSAVDVSMRWHRHRSQLRNNKHHNLHLQRSWNLYGEDAFEFVVLEECPVDQLVEREQHYMDQCSDKYNVDLVAGSRLGSTHSTSTKAKMSAAARSRTSSPETRAKISASLIGNTNAAGTPTPEAVAKRSAALVGHVVSPETRRKISAAKKGWIVSDETRKRMSDGQKKRWDKKRSQEGESVTC